MRCGTSRRRPLWLAVLPSLRTRLRTQHRERPPAGDAVALHPTGCLEPGYRLLRTRAVEPVCGTRRKAGTCKLTLEAPYARRAARAAITASPRQDEHSGMPAGLDAHAGPCRTDALS